MGQRTTGTQAYNENPRRRPKPPPYEGSWGTGPTKQLGPQNNATQAKAHRPRYRIEAALPYNQVIEVAQKTHVKAKVPSLHDPHPMDHERKISHDHDSSIIPSESVCGKENETPHLMGKIPYYHLTRKITTISSINTNPFYHGKVRSHYALKS